MKNNKAASTRFRNDVKMHRIAAGLTNKMTPPAMTKVGTQKQFVHNGYLNLQVRYTEKASTNFKLPDFKDEVLELAKKHGIEIKQTEFNSWY